MFRSQINLPRSFQRFSASDLATSHSSLATATSGRLPRATPWQVIPDGQGGSLVAWTDYSAQQPPDYITHLGPSGQNDYPFPSLFQTISPMVLGENNGGWPRLKSWVAFDKKEGVVKRHFFTAMLCSTAWISEKWRTEALKLSR